MLIILDWPRRVENVKKKVSTICRAVHDWERWKDSTPASISKRSFERETASIENTNEAINLFHIPKEVHEQTKYSNPKHEINV